MIVMLTVMLAIFDFVSQKDFLGDAHIRIDVGDLKSCMLQASTGHQPVLPVRVCMQDVLHGNTPGLLFLRFGTLLFSPSSSTGWVFSLPTVVHPLQSPCQIRRVCAAVFYLY
jgi:hypothetical protein